MDQKVLYNGQLLTLTRFWETGEPGPPGDRAILQRLVTGVIRRHLKRAEQEEFLWMRIYTVLNLIR